MVGIPPSGDSSKINPTGPTDPSSSPPPPLHGSGGGAMTSFMALFTPEERKQFMDILVKNISREMEEASKKYIEELERERDEIEHGS